MRKLLLLLFMVPMTLHATPGATTDQAPVDQVAFDVGAPEAIDLPALPACEPQEVVVDGQTLVLPTAGNDNVTGAIDETGQASYTASDGSCKRFCSRASGYDAMSLTGDSYCDEVATRPEDPAGACSSTTGFDYTAMTNSGRFTGDDSAVTGCQREVATYFMSGRWTGTNTQMQHSSAAIGRPISEADLSAI